MGQESGFRGSFMFLSSLLWIILLLLSVNQHRLSTVYLVDKYKWYDIHRWKWTLYTIRHITKTYLYNFDPLKSLLYSKTGVNWGIHYFLISAQKHRLWVLVRTASMYICITPQYMFWAEIWKISVFLSENFHFLVVKFSVYLNRLVFVENKCNACRHCTHESYKNMRKYPGNATITKHSPPLRHQQKERWTNNDKTIATYETTTNKEELQQRTALEQSVG